MRALEDEVSRGKPPLDEPRVHLFHLAVVHVPGSRRPGNDEGDGAVDAGPFPETAADRKNATMDMTA